MKSPSTNNSTVDKIIHLLLVVAGLVFLLVDKSAQNGNMFTVAIIVILGGAVGLVQVPALGNTLAVVEKALGVPLVNGSVSTGGTASSAGPSSTSSTGLVSTSQASNSTVPFGSGQ